MCFHPLEVFLCHVWWKVAGDLWGQCSNSWPKFLIGDLNLRWHCRLDAEREILGPHVVGRGQSYLENLEHHHNRDLALEFCYSLIVGCFIDPDHRFFNRLRRRRQPGFGKYPDHRDHPGRQ